ncbi:MAG: hypothetical protein P8J64_03205 [Dehalococcoidia bacterium]|nr:hypothetical protein [Dehalococcoidia bacterium]
MPPPPPTVGGMVGYKTCIAISISSWLKSYDANRAISYWPKLRHLEPSLSASDAASYVTGGMLCVDGGHMA